MQNRLTSTCQYKFLLDPSKTCKHPPLKGDRDKFCIFHSRDDKKDKGAFWEGIQAKLEAKDFDFTGYYFPPGLEADFGGKKFKDAKFIGAIFKGDVNFNDAEFSGESTNFFLVEFSGESTDFRWAKFSGKSTDFIEAEFSGKDTNFSDAKFSGEGTDFRWAEFSGESTNFSGAEFSGKSTAFIEAKFLGESTDFSHADFSGCGTVRFLDMVFKGECNFLEVEFPFRSDQFVIFAGTRDPIDLGNTVFLYSNYDRLTFRNCKFPERTDELFGWKFPLWRRRATLKDEDFVDKKLELKKEGREGKGVGRETVPGVEEAEEEPSVKVEFSHVESLYRQFKKNLEAEKDWELAGEFHYGEMECKRKGLPDWWFIPAWLRKNFGLLAFYKYFSGYGERPIRALCWIGFFIFLFFPRVYCLFDTGTTQDYEYYFWELSVKASFLQRVGEEGNDPIGLTSKIFYLLQSTLCPTLIALFILALRRRVRR